MCVTLDGKGPRISVIGTGDEGARTLNLRIANAALSQLSYVPKALTL